MSKKLLNFLIFFLAFSLIFQVLFKPSQPNPAITDDTVLTFETAKPSYSIGQVVSLKIFNNTDKNILISNQCPKEPLTAVKVSNGEYSQKTAVPFINCAENTDPATKDILLKPKKTTTIRYTLWSHELFGELGRYKIISTFKYKNKTIKVESNEFEITDRGLFSKISTFGFYQPLYNFLIYLIKLAPGYNLGIAIIILTVLIRLVLFIPNQRALKAQRRMSEVQPKLNAVREKYKDNQEMMAQETMRIWKENKVSPLGGCLPILIQFPVLLALFRVIQDGLNPDKIYLLYDQLHSFDFTLINTNFLGILELTVKNPIVLPIVIGGLQFIQLKLAMAKKKPSETKSEAEITQQMMTYFMPAMIAVFTASVPAGVGLYWGASTLFGIGQQLLVNKESIESESKKHDIRVKKVDGENNKERKKKRYKK